MVRTEELPISDFINFTASLPIWGPWIFFANNKAPLIKVRGASEATKQRVTTDYETALDTLKFFFIVKHAWPKLKKIDKDEIITIYRDNAPISASVDLFLRSAHHINEKAVDFVHRYLTEEKTASIFMNAIQPFLEKAWFKQAQRGEDRKEAPFSPYGIAIDGKKWHQVVKDKTIVTLDADEKKPDTKEKLARAAMWLFGRKITDEHIIETKKGYHVHFLVRCEENCEKFLAALSFFLTNIKYSAKKTGIEIIRGDTPVVLLRTSDLFSKSQKAFNKKILVVDEKDFIEKHNLSGFTLKTTSNKKSYLTQSARYRAMKLRTLDLAKSHTSEFLELAYDGHFMFATSLREFSIQDPVLISTVGRKDVEHKIQSSIKKARINKARTSISYSIYGGRFLVIRDKKSTGVSTPISVLMTNHNTPLGYYDHEANKTVWKLKRIIYGNSYKTYREVLPGAAYLEELTIMALLEKADFGEGEVFTTNDLLEKTIDDKYMREHHATKKKTTEILTRIAKSKHSPFKLIARNHNNRRVFILVKEPAKQEIRTYAEKILPEHVAHSVHSFKDILEAIFEIWTRVFKKLNDISPSFTNAQTFEEKLEAFMKAAFLFSAVDGPPEEQALSALIAYHRQLYEEYAVNLGP